MLVSEFSFELACQIVYLPDYEPTHLPAAHLAFKPTYSPDFKPDYKPNYLFVSELVCQPTFKPFFSPNYRACPIPTP
ncbi:MAG: hypothetical protein ABIK93_04240 [candidate division WOR-3 bacterium]